MKKIITTFMALVLLSFCSYAATEKAKVEYIFGGIIKGSVTDYFPDDLKSFSIIYIAAFADNPWAGKLYLTKKYKEKNSMGDATYEFYSKARDYAFNYAGGFCESKATGLGLKKAYYMIDNFEVSHIAEEGMAHYFVSGNIICLSDK